MPRPRKFQSDDILSAVRSACDEFGGPAPAKVVAEVLGCGYLTVSKYLKEARASGSVLSKSISTGTRGRHVGWFVPTDEDRAEAEARQDSLRRLSDAAETAGVSFSVKGDTVQISISDMLRMVSDAPEPDAPSAEEAPAPAEESAAPQSLSF